MVLDVNEFSKCSKSKNGLQSVCKLCKSKKLSDYYKLNPKKRYYNKEKQKDRYQNNKVTFNFSRRMRKSLNGIKESKSWENLVNYKLEDLKSHLEKQFKDGMSWENYGKWHIDHIIPISNFTIDSVESEEFKKCWSLNNLQPLWADENIKKSNKMEE
jgi:5-methylcytosine-specific restriction endonuclease McrA